MRSRQWWVFASFFGVTAILVGCGGGGSGSEPGDDPWVGVYAIESKLVTETSATAPEEDWCTEALEDPDGLQEHAYLHVELEDNGDEYIVSFCEGMEKSATTCRHAGNVNARGAQDLEVTGADFELLPPPEGNYNLTSGVNRDNDFFCYADELDYDQLRRTANRITYEKRRLRMYGTAPTSDECMPTEGPVCGSVTRVTATK